MEDGSMDVGKWLRAQSQRLRRDCRSLLLVVLGLCLGVYSAIGLPFVQTTSAVIVRVPQCEVKCDSGTPVPSNAAPKLVVKQKTETEDRPDGLLIVGGLALAVLLISLGTLLPGFHFAENSQR
jgi:hypothetical protein